VVGPWPADVFVNAARAALRLSDASVTALAARLGRGSVTLTDGHDALEAVATAEQAGPLSPGGKPIRSRCALNNCRRYHLGKALSVPAPAAAALIARTLTSITLRVHGCVGTTGGCVHNYGADRAQPPATPRAQVFASRAVGLAVGVHAALNVTYCGGAAVCGGRHAVYFEVGPVECVVEANGAVVVTVAGPAPAAAADHARFLDTPETSVTLTDLAPGAYTLRYRFVAAARRALPWSAPVTASTLRLPKHPAGDHPPVVVRVVCSAVTLRVRNPGARGASVRRCLGRRRSQRWRRGG